MKEFEIDDIHSKNSITTNILNSENKLEYLLNNHVGFNIEQFKIFTVMIFFAIADGFIMTSNSLIVQVISTPWDLSELMKGILGSGVFLGFTLGSLFSGTICDSKGRKYAYIISCFINSLSGLLGYFSKSAIAIIISNNILGFGMGIGLSSIFTLMSEVCNQRYRSILLTGIWVFFPSGGILAAILSLKLEIYDYHNSNWRLVMLFRSFCVS